MENGNVMLDIVYVFSPECVMMFWHLKSPFLQVTKLKLKLGFVGTTNLFYVPRLQRKRCAEFMMQVQMLSIWECSS